MLFRSAITKKSVEENAKDMLNEYEEETSTHEDSSNAPKEIKEKIKQGKKIQDFLATKKRKFKSLFRRKRN